MIPFDFEYHRPTSLHEAVTLFQALSDQNKKPLYLSGGTEITTLGRGNLLRTGAVIDLKAIPECRALRRRRGRLELGAALSLTAVAESGLFPLLSETVRQIADHTARNKITLGGNLCSQIIYREAVLPLLVADCDLVLAGPNGVRVVPIHRVFARRMRLDPGEFIVQVQVSRHFVSTPWFAIKRRRSGPVGYPIISLAALKTGGWTRVALSGACRFPFRSARIEAALNDPSMSLRERVAGAFGLLPAPLLDDMEASAEYRAFVLRNALLDALTYLEGVDQS